MRKVLVLSLCLLFALTAIAFARNVSQGEKQIRVETPRSVIDLDLPLEMQGLKASALVDTFYLGRWDFDSGVLCDNEGWTHADLTAQLDCFFHVDDFTGLGGGSFGLLVPIEGNQSLWCGVDGSESVACGYVTPPGYGNRWDQSWVFKCITANTAEYVTISYHIVYDSEPGYDYTYVEYVSKSTCDSIDTIDEVPPTDWVTLATYDYFGDSVAVDMIPAGHDGEITIRFHFVSDVGWSDEDGLWDTDGGCVIDEISVDGEISGNYDNENFEDEAVGDKATVDGDWSCEVLTGYSADGMAMSGGSMNCDAGTDYYACLYQGMMLIQENPSTFNPTCMWAFISGSTETYACGGYPMQKAVPKENDRGQFITEEIWSPMVDWNTDMYGNPASGSTAEIEFDVYRDLPIANLVYYVWHVRSIDASGCPGEWRDWGFRYWGDNNDWLKQIESVGALIDPTADKVQVALGCWDMCGYWCNIYGDGSCHSHAPLFDNVVFRRIGINGPTWSARDIDLFQDTWSTDSDDVWGCGRVDAAIDRAPSASWDYYPGDTAVVTVGDPVSGLGLDGNCRGVAAYCYVNMRLGPMSPPFNPAAFEGFDDCGNRWPYVPGQDRVCIDGTYWYAYCMDTVFTEAGGCFTHPVANKFCIDFNDCYMMAMDTLEFFFGGMNAIGQWTYWRQGCLDGMPPFITPNFDEACVCPMEMQILPGAGYYRGGDIFYVDQCSGRGAQPYFDWSFKLLGIDHLVDRFDKRGPGSLQGNGVAMLCNNWTTKIMDIYHRIIWNSGNLSAGTAGNGTPWQDKSNDCVMMDYILTFHQYPIPIYIMWLSGDDLAEEWAGIPECSGFSQKWIPHNLITGDHHDLGHPDSPVGVGTPPGYVALSSSSAVPSMGLFYHGLFGPDIFFVEGEATSDFDVIDPVTFSTLEMAYEDEQGLPLTPNYNPAIIAALDDTINVFDKTNLVVLSGFSFDRIRDDRPGPGGVGATGVMARVDHMRDILDPDSSWIANPVPVVETPTFTNSLAQNYPNPFNPTTTIKYSIKERAHVTLKIYNVAGQLVKTLVDQEQNPRADGFAVRWNSRSNAGDPVSSGIYFYKLVTKDFTQTKKMVLLK